MRDAITKNWYWLLSIVVFAIIGFFVGRSHSDVIKEVKYVKGKTITKEVEKDKLVPYDVYIPGATEVKWKTKFDTVLLPGQQVKVFGKIDTNAILHDYIKENRYNITLFDNDTIGKMSAKPVVQYNKIKSFGYDFTPIQKETVIERKRNITPFGGVGFNTFQHGNIEAGVFIKNIGVSGQYIKDFNTQNTGYGFGIKIKF